MSGEVGEHRPRNLTRVAVVLPVGASLSATKLAARRHIDALHRCGATVEPIVVGSGAGEISSDSPFLGSEVVAADMLRALRYERYDAVLAIAAEPSGLFGCALGALQLEIPSTVCGANQTERVRMTLSVLRGLGVESLDEPDYAAARLVDRALTGTSPRRHIDWPLLAEVGGSLQDNDHAIEMLVYLVSVGVHAGVPTDIVELLASASRVADGTMPVAVTGPLARRGALAWDLPAAATQWSALVAKDREHAVRLITDGEAADRAVVVAGQGTVGGPGPSILLDVARAARSSSAPPAAVITDGVLQRLGFPTFSLVAPEAAMGGALGLLRGGEAVCYNRGTLDFHRT